MKQMNEYIIMDLSLICHLLFQARYIFHSMKLLNKINIEDERKEERNKKTEN